MTIFTVVGCDDNKFLEEDPETFYTIDNVFTTSEQVDLLLAISKYIIYIVLIITLGN